MNSNAPVDVSELGNPERGGSGEEDVSSSRVFGSTAGFDERSVREMSLRRGEPDWMLDLRLEGHRCFEQLPMPDGSGDALSEICFDDVTDLGLSDGQAESSGGPPVTARRESEVVLRRNRDDLERRGVLFIDMDTALREHPELVKPHFGTIIPPNDHKFSALNTSVWSGGSFIYVPPGVEVEVPLQPYSGIDGEMMSRFGRTLIVADEGSRVRYLEGCSAPVYTSNSLRSAVVEIVVKPHAHVTHTTMQNWSSNVFTLATKRAWVGEEGRMQWIEANMGSRVTMSRPGTLLAGPKATGEVLSVAYAGKGQHQHTGAEMVHLAPETTSKIGSKSISKDGGRSTHRSLVRVEDDAYGCKSHVQCDALILDDDSVSDTYPHIEIGSADAQIAHEVTASKVVDGQLFYLMSRGLSEERAIGMIVNGFIEPVTRTLPMEYAVEWSRLIELQMEGSVG